MYHRLHHKIMHLVRLLQLLKIRKCTFLFIIFTSFCLMVILISRSSNLFDEDREIKLRKIDELIKTQASSLACKQPNLPVNSPEMMKFVHSVPKIDCSKAGDDWVKCVGSVCSIQENANIKYGPIKCTFADVIRLDDFKNVHGEPQEASTYTLRKSDVVHVSCESSTKKWIATLTGIRKDEIVWNGANWDNLPPNALKMDVLMFGFDSLSRNTFIRKLPKSYEYLTEELEGDVLKGYNIVGDGTPQALIPILTGKTELELPDTRKRIKNTKFVNSYPFIWNDYKDAGYVTAFLEDVPELGTFTYRLNGFDEPPTDHYMRPYYLENYKGRSRWPKLCTGEIPRHKVMLNTIRDIFAVYKTKPKFLFGFHGELSHDDYNLIGVADDDLLEFLKELNESGALNNSILILMADHGHRFAEIRNTVQGKQEERLPFFSFTFPRWFKEKHADIYENFRNNIDRLTTPFDVHATLKAVLNPRNVGVADISQRAVSLFSRIPEARSCAHAYIEPHWCACLDWHEIPTTDPIVERLGETLLDTINKITSDYRQLCEPLVIANFQWVTKMSPNNNLLRFNKNADLDGFVADLSANMNVKNDMYQLKVMMKPGNSLFEASITHNLNTDTMQLKLGDISRINMYGRQARCIENDLPQLRKYCYCRDDIKWRQYVSYQFLDAEMTLGRIVCCEVKCIQKTVLSVLKSDM
ncbi:unnamed protein product [Acanthoscelides obtectus]|uniref:Uncharacterized protein n=2 Tax=Acanthoscelides obtectus TaxID=200917 RepID=A0A9P0JYT5_ACAOB|nr:unnamed protein product [Acanthoscelides obtectus]CAK1637371.1 hypothetical protein AOBTE_LOCUS9937 [Acanthoscelides obtectus]